MMCFYGHRVMRLSKKEPVRLDILKFDNLLTIDWFGVNGSPTFYKITKKKDVEEFKTDPYLATVLNCAFWVFYGIGLVFEFVYLTIFIVYVKKAGRKKVGLYILVEAILFADIVLITMLALTWHYQKVINCWYSL
ncbi:Nodulin MtN3 family protein [Trifolium repens]|nr:Nodulin MtN3 family protein [Trifolium repens]